MVHLGVAFRKSFFDQMFYFCFKINNNLLQIKLELSMGVWLTRDCIAVILLHYFGEILFILKFIVYHYTPLIIIKLLVFTINGK